MAKKTKKKKAQSSSTNDYDLQKSLNKVNQHKNLTNIEETSTSFEIDNLQSKGINQANLNENLSSETTSIFFQLNESINSRYDTLNDSIKNVNNKISDSSDTLRQELETKINSKLDTQFFLYAIGALVVITGLIFTLSYSTLISDTKDNSTSVKSLEKDIKNQKDEITDIEKGLEKIDKKQNHLEIEIIKKHK